MEIMGQGDKKGSAPLQLRIVYLKSYKMQKIREKVLLLVYEFWNVKVNVFRREEIYSIQAPRRSCIRLSAK